MHTFCFGARIPFKFFRGKNLSFFRTKQISKKDIFTKAGMGTFFIKKGRDIPLQGKAGKEIVSACLPPAVAVQPPDFHGLKLRLAVKEGDDVKAGSPVLTDKTMESIRVASPVAGKVTAIHRGEKRALLEVVIEPAQKQEAEVFKSFTPDEIPRLSKEDISAQLQESGLWPVIRQRPFGRVAHPGDSPKCIFIHAMNTVPLAPDIDFILEGREKAFQAGLDILRKLTPGKVHVCIDGQAQSKALTEAMGVESHRFSGPHPTGNVGTHIHCIDPIRKGDLVWFVEAQDVLRIAFLFLNGAYSAERIVAVTGEGAGNRIYKKTVIGAPLAFLSENTDLTGLRCISGSVLTGKDVGPQGFLRFYDTQITIIPAGGKREVLGWLAPGWNKFSFSKTFLSALSSAKTKEVSLDTDRHGSDRAIVLNNVYDPYVTLDILTFFLLRAVIAGDIDEAERLGILECDEEDFALCTFACPSKTNVGGIIRQGLEEIEREG